MARLRKVVGGGQAGRPGADDGDPPAGGSLPITLLFPRTVIVLGRIPLDALDGRALVEAPPTAIELAGVRADIPQRAREGDFFPHYRGGVAVLALFDEPYVPRHVDTGGAGLSAGNEGGPLVLVLLEHTRLVADRAGRTDLHTGAAELTPGGGQISPLAWSHHEVLAFLDEGESIDPAQFGTGSDTPTARDTADHIVHDQRVRLDGRCEVQPFADARVGELEVLHQRLQLAVEVDRA